MPTYFMNLRDGETITNDPEGEDYASIEDARREAFASGRELGADALKFGSSLDAVARKSFEIRNKAGELLSVVSFMEAFAR